MNCDGIKLCLLFLILSIYLNERNSKNAVSEQYKISQNILPTRPNINIDLNTTYSNRTFGVAELYDSSDSVTSTITLCKACNEVLFSVFEVNATISVCMKPQIKIVWTGVLTFKRVEI